MKIVLIGYMASGKSLIGRKLASFIDFNFIDLDTYIEKKEKETIVGIFESKGEIYFRKQESKYLKEVLNTKRNIVLSLGGGTPCYANNMQTLIDAENVETIYLKSSINTLTRRLISEKDKRPLVSRLKNKEEIEEFIGKHIFERSFYYSQSSIIIDADKDVKSIIETILLKLF